MVRGADRPIPCNILPKIISSKLSASTQTILAIKNIPKPTNTIGFRPRLSDIGPNSSGPKPKPIKIMVISN